MQSEGPEGAYRCALQLPAYICLRCPTERTLANMTAMLGLCESIRTGEEKFQLRRILEQLRLGWKSWSPRASAQVDTELQLAKLPAKVEDYPPALRERLQAETLCTPEKYNAWRAGCLCGART